MPRSSSKAKGGRTRTFTGCRTCRRRHTKCDEKRPSCNVCLQADLTCGGYAAQLLWFDDKEAEAGFVPEHRQIHDSSRHRYPLFSDAERQLMSDQLSESLGSQLAEDLLTDLDNTSRRLGRQTSFSVTRGPFGAFQASKDEAPVDSCATSSSTSVDSVSGNGDRRGDDASSEGVAVSEPQEWNQQFGQLDFEALDSALDFPMELILPSTASTTFSDAILDPFTSMLTDTTLFSSLNPGAVAESANHFGHLDGNSLVAEDQRQSENTLPREIPLGSNFETKLLDQASSLLCYYKNHIEATRTAIRADRKSPWQLVFLPCAFQTFAELSLLGAAPETRVTVLYALLALSAFHLHQSDLQLRATYHWRTVGTRHAQKAQYHMQKMLELEITSAGQSDYEEMLMAFLAMTMTSFYHAGRAPQSFLLEAEQLIRLRGLTDQKHHRVRILHHLYTYLRVLAEAMSTLKLPSTKRNQNYGLLESSRSPRFRVREESLNVGLDPTVEKPVELGYSDIHLEIQGLWTKTLHSSLYGIPESLMTLLSQTISLANEKAHLDCRARCDPKVSDGLKSHIKTLEERIWSWCLDAELTTTTDSGLSREASSTDQELIRHPQTQSMVRAFHRALAIHFYRRIFDVSAMVLQHWIRETIELLELCMETMVDDDDFISSLAWVAFIADSEAVLPDLQARAQRCVSLVDGRGFLRPENVDGDSIVG